MIDNLSLFFKKYFVPFLFTAIGLIILILGFSNNQSGIFKFSAVLMFGAGAISILYSLGKLKTLYVYVIGIAMGVIAAIAIYLSFDSVATSQQFENDKNYCIELSKQNLSDISYIQKAHKDQHGVYAGTWAELVDFANSGTVPSVVSVGTVPNEKITAEERDYLYGDDRPIDNNMTEEEAYRLSKWMEGPRHSTLFAGFKRDTVQISILKSKFLTKSYRENRKKLGFPMFNPKDLPFIPSSNGKKWKLEVMDSINVMGVGGPSLYISGKLPFPEIEGNDEMIEMSLGNLKTFEHTGSWEDE